MPGTVNIPTPATATVVVGSGPGAYATISAACAAAPAGATIQVQPGTYNEIANIAPKVGQTIIGWNGDDATNGVVVNMGDFQLSIANGFVFVFGVYFNFNTSTADKIMVPVTASNFTMEKCRIANASSTRNRGLVFTTVTDCILRDITILGGSNTYNHIYMTNCSIMTLNRFRITNGTSNPAVVGPTPAIYFENCTDCNSEDINFQGLTTYASAYALIQEYNSSGAGTYRPNTYRNWIVLLPNTGTVPNAFQIDSSATQTKGDLIDGWYISGGRVQISVRLTNDAIVTNCSLFNRESNAAARNVTLDGSNNCVVDACHAEVGGNGYSFEITNGDNNVFSNCSDSGLSGSGKSWNVTNGSGVSSDNLIIGCNTVDDMDIVSCTRLTVTDCVLRGVSDLTLGANNVSFIGCYFGDQIDVNASNCDFVGCSIDATINVGPTSLGDDNVFSGCDIGTMVIAAGADRTILNGCYITTLTNNGLQTTISGSIITTFTDAGGNTRRDVYTQETLAGAATIRGSRDYDNDAAVGGYTITLPNNATKGWQFRVTVLAAQTITIAQLAGQQIRVVGSISTAGVGGSVASNVVGSVIEIEAVSATLFIAKTVLGTWTVT